MSHDSTDSLISRLATRVAENGDMDFVPPLSATLIAASACSLVVALAIALTVFGSDTDLTASFANPWLYWKLLCMSVLASGAWRLTRDLARPSYARPRIAVLAAALVLLGLGAVADPSNLSVGGRITASVPICLLAIVLQSLPGIVIVVAVLRASATSTRPTQTGAAAGMLSGALGAAAYATVCRNDGGLFVFVWYGTGVATAAAIGAIAGRRLLAW